MDDIRYFCNHSREELNEHRRNHPPQQLVIYSEDELPKHLQDDPVFVDGFMPALWWEIRQVIRKAYDLDYACMFSVRYGRLRAEFCINSSKMFEKHKAALGQIAEFRWPGISKKDKDSYATKNFDSTASKSVINGYVWLASGVFDAVLRPMYLDYFDRALALLGENHEIYDVVIAKLFPGRAARKKAAAAAEAAAAAKTTARKRRRKEKRERKEKCREEKRREEEAKRLAAEAAKAEAEQARIAADNARTDSESQLAIKKNREAAAAAL